MSTIDEEIQSKFSCSQQKALVNILFTSNWVKNIHSDLLKPFDITLQQYNILRILRGSKKSKMTMQSVKSRMVEKSPNTTRLTDMLLEKKYIVRTRCDNDRRVVYVQISKEGLLLLESIDVIFDTEISKIHKNLTDNEAEVLSSLLDKLRV